MTTWRSGGRRRGCGSVRRSSGAPTTGGARRRPGRLPPRSTGSSGRTTLRSTSGGANGWPAARRPPVRRVAAVAGPSGGGGPAPFLGTSGFGRLDNVSVLERLEDGAARWAAGPAARWSSCTRTRCRTPAAPTGPARWKAQLRVSCTRVYPETPSARSSRRSGDRDDCPLFGTGHWRPPRRRARPTRGWCWRATGPLRLPGGADGARRHHRLSGRQRAAERLGRAGQTCGPCRWPGVARSVGGRRAPPADCFGRRTLPLRTSPSTFRRLAVPSDATGSIPLPWGAQ